MFYINVIGQKMYISSTPEKLVTGSQEFVKFRFEFSEEWDGLTVFAQFRQGDKAYNKYLDGNQTVRLPAEIQEGSCTLMLYGSYGTVIGTTNYLTFRVDKDIFLSDASSTDISESLYTQLVTRVGDLESRLKQVEENGVSTERIAEVVDEEIQKYIASGQIAGAAGAVLYDTVQNLTAAQRKVARENLGIYTGSEEPTNPQEGDVWIDPESEQSGSSNPQIHVKAYEQVTDVLSMDFSEFKAGDIVLAYQLKSEISS